MNALHRPRATGPAAWKSADLRSDGAYRLAPEQVREIVQVARSVPFEPGALASVSFADRMPATAALMMRVRAELVSGRGVALLRGVPVGELTVDQASVAFWALGSFVGHGVSQSSAGELVGQVRDRGSERLQTRGYQSSAALSFHVDLADLLGLLCVRPARSGGQSLVASSLTVYNEMLDHHPEYLDALEPGFPWSRNGEEGPGEPAYSRRIPVYVAVDGIVSCRFNPAMIRRGCESAGEPLTPLQERAFAFMLQTAALPENCFTSFLEPGDIQFLNNYTTWHSRTAFDDWPDPGLRRLMLRLWLRDAQVRPFGSVAATMRDEPLVYNRQGRSPRELASAS